MYEPIAYVPADEGRILCPTCADEYAKTTDASLDDAEAFDVCFDGIEADSIQTCDSCRQIIDGFTLTSEGVAYTRAAVLNDLNDDKPAYAPFLRALEAQGEAAFYSYGYGCPGCLYDSTGGYFDKYSDAAHAMLDLYIDDEDVESSEVSYPDNDAPDGIINDAFITFTNGAYAEVYTVSEVPERDE